jgi:hypothetical protein
MSPRTATATCVLFFSACCSKGQHVVPAVDGGRIRVIDARRASAAKPDVRPAGRRDSGAADQAELIVGSKRGLEAWRADGSSRRLISGGAALYPRWLDDKTILVIVARAPEDLAKGARLERISLANGKRSRVARVPPFACQRSRDAGTEEREPELGLHLEDPGDFEVDEGGRRVCIDLMDRNVNMVSYWVRVVIDLKKGRVERWLTMGQETCIPPAGVKVTDAEHLPDCTPADKSTTEADASRSFPFDFTDDGILRQGQGENGQPMLKIPGYESERLLLSSPSGRWIVLRGDVEEGDYIHASLVLLDREEGEIYPIQEGRTWPPPLRAPGKQKLPRIKTPIDDTVSVVGETDVRWLGASADTELLIVGDLVLKPGEFSFAVDGSIAR